MDKESPKYHQLDSYWAVALKPIKNKNVMIRVSRTSQR
jgi:hypothetical protein